MIRADDPVSMAEASAILDLPGDVLDRLTGGPFAADHGCISLRQVLGIATMVDLAMLDPATAVRIAATASADAQHGGQRLLSIAWIGGVPNAAWVEAITDELGRPAFVLPAEAMLTTLAARLVAYRAARTRPN